MARSSRKRRPCSPRPDSTCWWIGPNTSSSEDRMRRLAALEPVALFVVLMAYIWVWRFRHPYLWMAMLGGMVLSHLIWRESARDLGFGRQSLRECAHRFAPAITVLALLMLAAGLLLHT